MPFFGDFWAGYSVGNYSLAFSVYPDLGLTTGPASTSFVGCFAERVVLQRLNYVTLTKIWGLAPRHNSLQFFLKRLQQANLGLHFQQILSGNLVYLIAVICVSTSEHHQLTDR